MRTVTNGIYAPTLKHCLKTLTWWSFFPDFFDTTEDSDEENEQLNYNTHMIEDVNNEDGNVHTEINGNFNMTDQFVGVPSNFTA